MMQRKYPIGEIVRRVLLVTACVVLAAVIAILVGDHVAALRADEVHGDVRRLYPGSALVEWLVPRAAAETAQPTAAQQEPVLPPIHEDFALLYETNADVVGWLTAGEEIDLPVVQLNNSYYLTHNFYGERDSNGTLFVNAANSLIPRDDVVLIHGHNMGSGRMFGKLAHYMDYEYLCRFPLVTFRTVYDEADVYYTPVVAFNASMMKDSPDYFDIAQFVFEDDAVPEGEPAPQTRQSAEFSAHISAMQRRSEWEPLTDVTVEDELLMLVTCSYYHDDGRFMLVCRKLREGETPDDVTALYAPEAERFMTP